jgi:hypothetical protein
MGAKASPPPNLLTVGVVTKRVTPAPAAAPTNTAKAPEDADAVAVMEAAVADETKPAKKRAGARKATRKKTAAPEGTAPAAKRGGRKKTAANS